MSAALVLAVLALGIVLVRVADWWSIRRHRHEGLVDPRVLRPLQQRVRQTKRASA